MERQVISVDIERRYNEATLSPEIAVRITTGIIGRTVHVLAGGLDRIIEGKSVYQVLIPVYGTVANFKGQMSALLDQLSEEDG
jgi:hypothetical protein